ARTRADVWNERIGDKRVIAIVKDHISLKGPSRARAFARLGGRTGPWWGWGPAKAALEWLWRTGELAVLERDGFEKVYELAERAIPKGLLSEKPSLGESREWAFNDAL